MRLTFVAFGTRGDVTPLIALGARLRALGHRIRLASHREFEGMARQHGFEFHPIPGSFQDFLATREGRRALGVPTNTPLGLTGVFGSFRRDAAQTYRDCWEAAADAEGLVCSTLATNLGALMASRRDVPLAIALAVPTMPSQYLPHPAMPPWPLGPLYNRLSYRVAAWLVERGAGPVFAMWRAEAERAADRRPARPLHATTLVAASPVLAPRPVDWPPQSHVTGFWWLPPQAAAVPAGLRAFVERGDPPICIGFGSMVDDEPDQLRALVSDALALAKVRAVLVTGSGHAVGQVSARDTAFEIAGVDYGWLFPRVRAVVHQGGVGTASYCLRAGVPQVTVAYCLDHAFWAWRLSELGVAPRGLRRHRLTAESLAAAIRQVLDEPKYRERAVAVAPQVRGEDGLGQAVAILAEHFGFDAGPPRP
jgi:UDP:flavonoid glycosyltransferase YjiC (YdhE family)